MTHLVTATRPIAGAHVVKRYPGHGILGSALPTTGDNGGSPVLNDGIDPNKRYAWRVVTPPSAGSLTIYPDLTFEQLQDAAPDGSYPWSYKLLEDGQDAGNAVVTTTFGVTEQAITVAASKLVAQTSALAIKQTHLLSVAASKSTTHASALFTGQGATVTCAASTVVNRASAIGIRQAHKIGAAASTVSTQSAPITIRQTHRIGIAASTGQTKASAVSIAVSVPGQVLLTLAASHAVTRSSVVAIGQTHRIGIAGAKQVIRVPAIALQWTQLINIAPSQSVVRASAIKVIDPLSAPALTTIERYRIRAPYRVWLVKPSRQNHMVTK